MKPVPLRSLAWPLAAFLTLSLLAGCEAGPGSADKPVAAAQFDPFPPGAATPFFFQTPAQWRQHADQARN